MVTYGQGTEPTNQLTLNKNTRTDLSGQYFQHERAKAEAPEKAEYHGCGDQLQFHSYITVPKATCKTFIATVMQQSEKEPCSFHDLDAKEKERIYQMC